jgi:hypothetical protein
MNNATPDSSSSPHSLDCGRMAPILTVGMTRLWLCEGASSLSDLDQSHSSSRVVGKNNMRSEPRDEITASRSLPWVFLFALAVLLAALLVLFLMADPGARIPPDVGYEGEPVGSASAVLGRVLSP